MKNFVKLLLSLWMVAGIGVATYSQDYCSIKFDSPSDSAAYMRLQELRTKPIAEMTTAELDEYSD
ncbi:MAG: hypothetical protein II575_00660, partial [Bacteroidales bacterium]|nr:hypothetical protein [Bacteroidales bacterium]